MITKKAISKKTAIETLIEEVYPEITIDQVMAFGDNYNDIEMLKGVGFGVAFPHAKTRSVKGIVIAFGRSDGGIDFAAMDHKPVSLFFLIAAPPRDPSAEVACFDRTVVECRSIGKAAVCLVEVIA